MPIDIGYILNGNDDCYCKVYYRQGFVPGAGQTYLDAPLINGPEGFCLLVVNRTGQKATATVFDADGTVLLDHVTVPTGDPVTSLSRRLNQMPANMRTRGTVGSVEFGG